MLNWINNENITYNKLKEDIMKGMKIIIGTLFILLIMVCGCMDRDRTIQRDYVNKYLCVGTKFNPEKYDIEYSFVEKTTEWNKYMILYPASTRIYRCFVTVKNDTIVAIWKKH